MRDAVFNEFHKLFFRKCFSISYFYMGFYFYYDNSPSRLYYPSEFTKSEYNTDLIWIYLSYAEKKGDAKNY